MSDFWSYYIIAIVVLNLVGCAALLFYNRKMSPEEAARDTTGHDFDGIVEKNTPLPRWWLWLFIITLVFSVIYLALYPGMGKYPGMLGWTSAGQWKEEVDYAKRQSAPLFEQYAAVSIDDLVSNPEYSEALEVGSRLFANNCAVCHGSDARGGRGFPNLTDNVWLYGGDADTVVASITNGRKGMMPPMRAAIGNTDQAVRDMATYVASLSRPEMKQDPQKAAAIERAAPKFAMCAACHGPEGKGNPVIGSANLTDNDWLYGGSLKDIEYTINNGRNGVMPAHKDLLDAEKIHVLAAYVLSLSRNGGGQ